MQKKFEHHISDIFFLLWAGIFIGAIIIFYFTGFWIAFASAVILFFSIIQIIFFVFNKSKKGKELLSEPIIENAGLFKEQNRSAVRIIQKNELSKLPHGDAKRSAPVSLYFLGIIE